MLSILPSRQHVPHFASSTLRQATILTVALLTLVPAGASAHDPLAEGSEQTLPTHEQEEGERDLAAPVSESVAAIVAPSEGPQALERGPVRTLVWLFIYLAMVLLITIGAVICLSLFGGAVLLVGATGVGSILLIVEFMRSRRRLPTE